MHLILTTFTFILLNVLSEGQVLPSYLSQQNVIQKPVQTPTFRADYNNSIFLKDGLPFQVISGEFEYYRSHPLRWRPTMRLMRAAGLNTLSMYVEWSFHNPQDGEYIWTGMANIEDFIQTAAEEDLLVVFRAGPYINSERSGVRIFHFYLNYTMLLP